MTTAGTAALEPARAALAAAGAVRQAVDEVNGLLRGSLVVGMVTACTVAPLFELLAAFHLAHPGVEITLIEDHSHRLVEQVRAGAADLALIGASGAPPQGLGALQIVSERLVAAVPPDHPLAKRSQVTLTDISVYPIVCMPPGAGVRAVFDQACAAQGIQANIALQASAPGAIADLAARGLGIAILSESMAANHTGRLKALALDDVDTPAVLALIWATTKSPALHELLRYAERAFPTHCTPSPNRPL